MNLAILFILLLSTSWGFADFADENSLLDQSKESQLRKGEEIIEVATLHLKNQNQEKAFSCYLKALECASAIGSAQLVENDPLYQKALEIYFKGSSSAKETAEKIIREFSKTERNSASLDYLIALAYANLENYQEFFRIFYRAYSRLPNHFLAQKTKAILSIKLMERTHLASERDEQRLAILFHLNEALKLEPHDTTLYRLLITFAFPENKREQVQRCLKKIIEENIIIPRGELLFYIQEATDVQERILAQRFLDQASSWYPQSRMVIAARQYLDNINIKP